MFISFSSFTAENHFILNWKNNFQLNQISTLTMKYNSAIATINANKTQIITRWKRNNNGQLFDTKQVMDYSVHCPLLAELSD